MLNGQTYAIEIEHILCRIFSCERFGFGGIVNSDFIRQHPYTAMVCGLAYIAATADNARRNEIETFISNFSFYSDMSIDTLLSFETSEKVIDGITIQLEEDNGQQTVEKIIVEFRKVVKD